MERALFHMENCYLIPNIRGQGYMCKTNIPTNTAFRGFGGPQVSYFWVSIGWLCMIDSEVSELVCFEIANYVLLKLKSLHSVLSNCRSGTMRWTGDIALSFWFDTSKMRNFFSDGLKVLLNVEMGAVRPGGLWLVSNGLFLAQNVNCIFHNYCYYFFVGYDVCWIMDWWYCNHMWHFSETG